MKCQEYQFPRGDQLNRVKINRLICGWELLVPETWEVYENDWPKTIRRGAIRFAWKRARHITRMVSALK